MKIHTLSWLMASIVGTVVAIPFQRDADSTYFFTFGNSYTTTQFNPKSNAPSASNPMGNPELGKGTTAGGPNWVAYLTTAQNASRILSYNLAVGGATIDNSLVKGSQVDLTKQVDVFQKTYSNKTKVPWTCDNAVFGIWIGINDIGHSYSDEDPEQFTPKLISRYKSLVEKIYKDGGRKFLFVNVPPASRTPKFLNEGAEAREKHAKYVSVFNKQLETMAKDIARQGGNVVLYDSWTFMTKVLNSPHKYGFPNATCINNDGKTCVWWNNYHPTSKYHQLQAKDMKAHLKPLGAW